MVVRSTSSAAALVAVALLAAASAQASWTPTRSGAAFSRATSVGQGNAPSGTKVNGKDVRLTWTATTLTNGAAVGGYLVRRYNAATGAEATVAANCSGTVTALTCTENNVPKGSWQYTITPTRGNWRGAQSTNSAAIAV
jgi:hypothetical protein